MDILSDGEQRRDNFYSFAVDKLNGMQLMKVSELLNYSADRARMEEVLRALDVPAFAIKSPIAIDILSKRQDWRWTNWPSSGNTPTAPSRFPFPALIC